MTLQPVVMTWASDLSSSPDFDFFFFFFAFIWLFQVLVAAHGIFSFSVWELVLRPGVKARPLHWECRVLVTAPPGKSFRPNFAVDSLCYFGVSHFHAQGLFSHLG